MKNKRIATVVCCLMLALVGVLAFKAEVVKADNPEFGKSCLSSGKMYSPSDQPYTVYYSGPSLSVTSSAVNFNVTGRYTSSYGHDDMNVTYVDTATGRAFTADFMDGYIITMTGDGYSRTQYMCYLDDDAPIGGFFTEINNENWYDDGRKMMTNSDNRLSLAMLDMASGIKSVSVTVQEVGGSPVTTNISSEISDGMTLIHQFDELVDGKIYLVSFTATDNCDNVSTGSVTAFCVGTPYILSKFDAAYIENNSFNDLKVRVNFHGLRTDNYNIYIYDIFDFGSNPTVVTAGACSYNSSTKTVTIPGEYLEPYKNCIGIYLRVGAYMTDYIATALESNPNNEIVGLLNNGESFFITIKYDNLPETFDNMVDIDRSVYDNQNDPIITSFIAKTNLDDWDNDLSKLYKDLATQLLSFKDTYKSWAASERAYINIMPSSSSTEFISAYPSDHCKTYLWGRIMKTNPEGTDYASPLVYLGITHYIEGPLNAYGYYLNSNFTWVASEIGTIQLSGNSFEVPRDYDANFICQSNSGFTLKLIDNQAKSKIQASSVPGEHILTFKSKKTDREFDIHVNLSIDVTPPSASFSLTSPITSTDIPLEIVVNENLIEWEYFIFKTDELNEVLNLPATATMADRKAALDANGVDDTWEIDFNGSMSDHAQKGEDICGGLSYMSPSTQYTVYVRLKDVSENENKLIYECSTTAPYTGGDNGDYSTPTPQQPETREEKIEKEIKETYGKDVNVETADAGISKASEGELSNGKLVVDGKAASNEFVKTDDGKTFFADASGKPVTETIVSDGKDLYFCGEDGDVQKDIVVDLPSGEKMIADDEGKLVTKEFAKVKVGGETYVTKENGIVARNEFVKASNNKTYYTGEDGAVKTGKFKADDGKQYIANKNGVVQKNKISEIGEELYYTNGKGKIVKNKDVVVDGVTYHAGKKGKLKRTGDSPLSERQL